MTKLATSATIRNVVCVLFLGGFVSASDERKFRSDDPLMEDPDRHLTIPQPTDRPLSKTVDLLQKTFTKPSGGQRHPQNVNTLGEVPDSSWFINRMSKRVMTIEELVRGPNQGQQPDATETWTILAAKTEGTTPGFRIRDGLGGVYFIKFDPHHWPQMATSTEIMGTKFFHAFGYNVPENYLVYWRPEYKIDPDAEVLWESGHVESLGKGFVEDVLENIPRRPDGTIQAVASKLLPGRPIGPFDFQGTRSDDPNDIFPHQDRRELRGLRLFCAWMNHNDSDSVNTLDIYYVDEEERKYAKHYLIDFGTTMGSGATHPHARRAGNEYYIEYGPALKSAATFGIWDRPWRHLKYEEYPSVGRFESSYFQPEKWKPDYPNPAFDKMLHQDALWATRTIMRFRDDAIRAIVGTGELEDPEAEKYMVDRLIERRDKIVRYYLAQINPLDGFHISRGADGGSRLEFVNLGVEAGLASECRYGHRWYRFDNETGSSPELSSPGTSSQPSLTIPEVETETEFLKVEIVSMCPDQQKWESGVNVFLRGGTTLDIVGIDRDDPPNNIKEVVR